MEEFESLFRKTMGLDKKVIPIKVNGKETNITLELKQTQEPRDWYVLITGNSPFRPVLIPLNKHYRGNYLQLYHQFVGCLRDENYTPVLNTNGDLVSLIFSS